MVFYPSLGHSCSFPHRSLQFFFISCHLSSWLHLLDISLIKTKKEKKKTLSDLARFSNYNFSTFWSWNICLYLLLTDGVSLPGGFWLCVHVPTNLQGLGSTARPCSCNSRMQLLLNPWKSTAWSGVCPVQVAPAGFSMPWVGSVCLETFPSPDWASFPRFLQKLQKTNAASNICLCFRGKGGKFTVEFLQGWNSQICVLTLFLGIGERCLKERGGRENSRKAGVSRGVYTNK